MNGTREPRRRAGREAIADLRRYRETIPIDRFLADRDDQRKVLHALLIAVQSCLDEALSACRERGLVADTYRGAFEALAQAGALSTASLPALLGWASFRNILAHFYPVLDLSRVHASLDEIDILEQFLDWCDAQRG